MKKKGSFTIFVSLILVAVMTLLCTMAECVRVKALVNEAVSVTAEAADSGFSEFNPYLWDNYRILGIDLSYGAGATNTSIMESRILRFARHNTTTMSPGSVKVTNYGLLTDNSGSDIITQGVKAARTAFITDKIDRLIAENNLIDTTEQSPDGYVAGGRSSIAAAKEEARAQEREEPPDMDDNPLDAFDSLRQMIAGGILSTVIDNDGEISNEIYNTSQAPSQRTNNVGTTSEIEPNSLLDKEVYIQYLLAVYGYYGSDLEKDGLQYEIEYLIGQKESDMENLATVAERILLMREAVNIAAITSSPSMMGQVSEVAAFLTGGIAAFMAPLEVALVAAWAYVESVMELRTVFSGGKIAILKNDGNWNSNLYHLSSCIGKGSKAANVEGGISYTGFLGGMLSLMSKESLGILSCDILENALNTQEDYKNVRVDNMLFKADISVSFSSQDIFYSLFPIDGRTIDGYNFVKTKKMTY